jgi:hypothetical protein
MTPTITAFSSFWTTCFFSIKVLKNLLQKYLFLTSDTDDGLFFLLYEDACRRSAHQKNG